jgi:hypothetical protein
VIWHVLIKKKIPDTMFLYLKSRMVLPMPLLRGALSTRLSRQPIAGAAKLL